MRQMLMGGGVEAVASAAQREFVGRVYLPLLHRVLEDWKEGQGEDEEEEDEDEEEMEADDKCGAAGGGCCGDHHSHDGHDHHHGHAHAHHHGDAAAAAAAAAPSKPPPSTLEEGVALLDECLAYAGPANGSSSEEEGGAGGLFSALDGTALLALICCMNHSCAPNCEVRWVGGLGGAPVVAELVALAPVGRGEELYQSYVKVEGTTVKGRRGALRDYGFVCRCPRCVAEEGAEK